MATYPRKPIPADQFTLSVVIPVFNERETIEEVLRRVRAVTYRKQVIVVDDGSSDGTRDKLRALEAEGAIERLILHGKADVVYGSRFLTGMAHRVLFYWHSVANRILTVVSNMVTNLNLTDMETCYKVFRAEVIRAIRIRENRFGFEPEITAKVARLRCRIYEVGISYDGRSYAEGKKIGWKDAVWAMVCLIRYGVFHRPPRSIDEIYAAVEAVKSTAPPAERVPARDA
jgi:glycosyltransferase involved in cell wall biosynthesis